MNQFNYTDAELAIIEKAEKEFDMAKAAKTRKIDTMHSMWNQPYFKRGTFLVSAYRVVHANFTKLGATLN